MEEISGNPRSEGVRRAWASPSVRARYRKAFRARWTEAYRKEFGKRMREAWRRRKEREAAGG